jgi:nitrogen fixation protein FixH
MPRFLSRSLRYRPAGWWYPWLFVGGMLIVIVVNAVLVFAALDTFPGLETTDHYRKGLAYNANLAAAREQRERGWKVDLSFAADAATAAEQGRGTLRVRFADRDGEPLAGLSVTAMLTRPAHAGHDFEVPLRNLGEGVYQATVALPLRGLWEARILARSGGGAHFQETYRLLAP